MVKGKKNMPQPYVENGEEEVSTVPANELLAENEEALSMFLLHILMFQRIF